MNQILIMSNDPILKEKNTEVLTAGGFRVFTASDALDGLLKVDKNGFDAIIIDDELTDMDGFGACQKIRQYSDIPIVLLGAEPEEKVWAKIDDLGFDMYLKKPVSPRELMARVKAALRRGHSKEKPKAFQDTEPVYTEPAPDETRATRRGKQPESQPTPVVPLQDTAPLRMQKDMDTGRFQQTPGSVDSQRTPVVPRQVTIPASAQKPVEVTPTPQVQRPTSAPPTPPTGISQPGTGFELWKDARVAKLIDALLIGRITEINPVIDISLAAGYAYPEADRLLETAGDETRHILDALVTNNILSKKLFEKLYVDSDGSFQLVPVERCPNCDLGNLTRGQLVEHFVCGNVGLDSDYKSGHAYVCPKCHRELKLVGTDYRSLGMRYRCSDCHEVFATPATKWRNSKTGKIWTAQQLQEVDLFSYSLVTDKRDWLEFQLQPKAQLIEFLKRQGYQVEELAQIHGKSGALHTIDILATMNDGIVKLNLGVGILTATHGESEVGLDELFKFDTRAYDMGLEHKVAIAMPRLSLEAQKFAERQRITVFQARDLGSFMTYLYSKPRPPVVPLTAAGGRYLEGTGPVPGGIASPESQLVGFLKHRGYEVYQNAEIVGRSGTEHIFDIFAQRDDGIIIPTVAVAITRAEKGRAVTIDQVLQFDTKAYDAGIRNKVLVAMPAISPDAKQFATQQRVQVFEGNELDTMIRTWASQR